MKAQVRALQSRCNEFWEARAPRERLTIASSAALLGIGLCLWFVHAVDRSRTELRTTVPALRARASVLEQQAAEFERLRTTQAATVSQVELRALVLAQAGAAGLSRGLTSVEAADANQVKVVFGAVAFADWLGWVTNLESQHVHLDACRIEALSTPGLVSVTATLVRPKQQCLGKLDT